MADSGPNRKRKSAKTGDKPRGPAPVTGKVVSSDDKFYLDWGRESLRNNLRLLNDVLRQLVTLTSTLLGGTVVFLDEKIINPSYKIYIIMAFFIALIIAFIGMLPHTSKVNLSSPSAIKEHKIKSTRIKRYLVLGAGTLVFVGFFLTGVGMLAKADAAGHVFGCRKTQQPSAAQQNDHADAQR